MDYLSHSRRDLANPHPDSVGVGIWPVESGIFKPGTAGDPRNRKDLPNGENRDAGAEAVDFAAILLDACGRFVCAECETELTQEQRRSVQFCSPKCRYRFRDRRRYAEKTVEMRARSRDYYWANRERVLERAAAKRGRPRTPTLTECSECGTPLEGKQRVSCGASKCRDARFKRLQPDSYAERERQKVERRREKRRESAE